MALCILMVICYALCVMAHDADERAERMYRKWAEEHKERVDEIANNLKADVISADKILVNERTMKGADDEMS
jgi:hypothetical protein